MIELSVKVKRLIYQETFNDIVGALTWTTPFLGEAEIQVKSAIWANRAVDAASKAVSELEK